MENDRAKSFFYLTLEIIFDLVFSKSIIFYSFKHKEVYICIRYNIGVHLDVLCKDKIISEHLENYMREDDHKLCLSKYSKWLFNDVINLPLESVISYQRDIRDWSITIRIENVRVTFNQ